MTTQCSTLTMATARPGRRSGGGCIFLYSVRLYETLGRSTLPDYSAVLLILMFAPQYSILIMLVSYYLNTNKSPFIFVTHLAVVYLFTFLACCSLLVCVVRDPGAIRVGEAGPHSNTREETEEENEETDMMDALRMAPSSRPRTGKGVGKPEAFDDDFNAPRKWCRKCWAPKPERTHHCSACGRCVLKMGQWDMPNC